MLIQAECPSCGSRYRLRADMIGKSMRCPNPACGATFAVRPLVAEPEPESLVLDLDDPSSLSSRRTTPELTPLPAAESVFEMPMKLEPARLDSPSIDKEWSPDEDIGGPADAPLLLEAAPQPPRPATPKAHTPGQPKAAAPRPVPKPAPKSPPPPPPAADFVFADDAPLPSQRKAPKAAARPAPVDDEILEIPDAPADPADDFPEWKPRRKAWSAPVLIGLVLALVATAGAGAYFTYDYYARREARAADDAQIAYEEKRYAEAAEKYAQVRADFPDSKDGGLYRFFEDLSSLRKTVYSGLARSEPDASLAAADAFVEKHKESGYLAADKFMLDLWETLTKLAEDLTAAADESFAANNAADLDKRLGQMEKLADRVAFYRPKDQPGSKLLDRVGAIRAEVARRAERAKDLADLRKLAEEPTEANIQAMEEFLDARNLRGDGEALAVVSAARQAQAKLIRYVAEAAPVPPETAGAPTDKSLLLSSPADPPREWQAAPGPLTPPGGVFLAQSRGVLVGLDAETGKPRWAVRVGVDQDSLPPPLLAANPEVRRPAEVVLVVSFEGEQPCLTARQLIDGKPLWRQKLDTPPLGQPVLVGRRAFVAQRDAAGSILEFEVTTGNRLGRIQTGRRLDGGGARVPGTGVVLFPAEQRDVFAFDADRYEPDGTRAAPTLVGVLRTGHPPRSMRAQPLVLVPSRAASDLPQLLLTQADGVDKLVLRAFPVPPADTPQPWPDAPPAEFRLQGGTDAAPVTDEERLALLTDRNELGYFGVNQSGNRDTVLFPFLRGATQVTESGLAPLDGPLAPPAAAGAGNPRRGGVVFVDETRVWVVAHEKLYQFAVGFDPREGTRLVLERPPLSVGSPAHPAQARYHGDLVCLVTELPDRSGTLVTALDVSTGKARWQRALGNAVQSVAPIPNGPLGLLDRSGALMLLQPGGDSELSPGWRAPVDRGDAGKPVLGLSGTPTLVPGEGELLALSPVRVGSINQVDVTRVRPGAPPARLLYRLPAALVGPALRVGPAMLLPLSDGTLHRLVLEVGAGPEAGPSWRDRRPGEASATGAALTLLNLGGGEFLVFDGVKTIRRVSWPPGEKAFTLRGERAFLQPPTGPPAVVPGPEPRLAVRDRTHTLSLLTGDNFDSPVQQWRANKGGTFPAGPLTGGPWVVARPSGSPPLLLVLVGDQKLVALEPERDVPLWVADLPDRGVLGEPRLVGERLWLAQPTAVVALAADSGKSAADAVDLPPGVIPAFGVIPYGPGALLAPLSDGTLLEIAS